MVTEAEPVKAVPGERPTSPPAVPLIVVGPVFVIVEPARTAKLLVVPRPTGGWAAWPKDGIRRTIATSGTTGSRKRSLLVLNEKVAT
jgi:hypothetical protein